ncbi:leukotriene B4 receptor 1-like [Dromaius novaehollandiae]|uniref:leukotriene B4 receptor 1-like n=1 Tax=Dromaius novaehollandiae TaxID=8790 RepID=UPI00311E09A7
MTLPRFSNTTAAPLPGATAGLVLLSLAFVVGLPGNAFVLWSSTVLTHRRSIPALLVTHLALADVATLLTAPVYLRFLSTGRWELGHAACQGCHYICAVAMYASVFLIVLMSLHRCLAVSRPTLALAGHSTRAAHGAVAAAWAMAFLLAVPTITFRQVSGEAPRERCQRAHNSTGWLVFHNLLETVAGWALPMATIAAGYGVLLWRLRHTRFRRKGRTQRLVVLVVVAFAAAWGPYHAINLLEVAGELRGTQSLRGAAAAARPPLTALAFFSSAVNPLLYACAGRGLLRTAGATFMARLFEGTASEIGSRRTGTERATQRMGELRTEAEGEVGKEDDTAPSSNAE